MLQRQLGPESPCWRLGTDSNTLFLSAPDGTAHASARLTAEQANAIRNFSGATNSLHLSVQLVQQPLLLHLTGRKTSSTEWSGTASDFSDTESVANNLVEELSFAEQVVSEANSVIFILDENGLIQRLNYLAEEYIGKQEKEVIGTSIFDLLHSQEDAAASQKNIASFFKNGSAHEAERWFSSVKGPRLFLFRNKIIYRGANQTEPLLICSGTDITEERQAIDRLRTQATTHPLTGLPNRHAMTESIQSMLQQNQHQPHFTLGVIFLDLDNFKRINDHYGHALGDKLLSAVAHAITACLNNGQQLGHIGGDEFIILHPNTSIEALEATAQSILEALQQPFMLDAIELYTSCSLGIALYPEHSLDAANLLRSADIAMHAAKESGKRGYQVFDASIDKRIANYMWLDSHLRKAISENLLELYYQPKISAQSGELCGLEALLRWPSSDNSLMAPSSFIPHAEESGLIGPLGLWVAEQAFAQAQTWQQQGLNTRIAINVSAQQIRNQASIESLLNVLSHIDTPRLPLDIELTESCLIENPEAVIDILHQFRELGAEVHLDDFGIGYSSLSLLTRLPLDAIKLDMQFVRNVHKRLDAQAIAKAITAVGQSLHLKVIAEGIESRDEEAFLKDIGVDQLQGYLYARPMQANRLQGWLQAR